MKIRTIRRHIREGILNLGRHGWMTFASILSVMITMLILGIFLLLAYNIDNMATNLESDVEIRAFVELEATENDLPAIERVLDSIDKIEHYEFVSKSDALLQFVDTFGDDAMHFEEFLDDPEFLPYTYVIQTVDPRDTMEVAQELRGTGDFYRVNDGGDTTFTLFSTITMIRNAGAVFVIGLAFTALLLIANTIKVTIGARKDEIEIMKLVGATNSFVRWPFVIEGLLLGVIGATIPAALLIFGYGKLLEVDAIALPFFQWLPTYPTALNITMMLVILGSFIGVFGSVVSIRRYLNV